ncbi:MAG: biotin carboxylase N-terminal domain-containing protein [Micrococcus sp.]|nr:biotin carboxylase N-terminal domain-containing protein [Micrococcus sp.]
MTDQTQTSEQPLFDTVLVANRGEIAVRVIETLQRLGIRAVAVYSDADAQARHVQLADDAVRLGPAPARESYLDIEAVVEAARSTGAQAVHPGYGFLSENAEFARALDAAGITFIGPPVASLDAMADKIRAKETVSAYDVPVVPGIADPSLSDEQIIEAAGEVGFPLLIKPSAGGGGKGMFEVRSAEELPQALKSARRTAASAFGDDTLLLERLITSPRHIEVQVFADSHGTTVHLAERECSLQRRHQKVIEEAPAPLLAGMDDQGEALRARLGEAAVNAAASVGYVGAGTVEFLVSDDNPDEFFFMEMNTRLQVEHPVSEEVVRVNGEQQDFVELQVRVAAGQPLGFSQDKVSLSGHALEARVYAEDPANGFLPSTGQVLTWEPPQGEGVRVDALLFPGAEDQPEITGFYDPMIAKIIVRGADRAEAMDRLDAALAETVLTGVTSNLAWLRFLNGLPEVRSGALTTTMIDAMDPWSPDQLSEDDLAVVAAHLAEVDTEARAEQGTFGTFSRPHGGVGAWAASDAWRAAGAPAPALALEVAGEQHAVAPATDEQVASSTLDIRFDPAQDPRTAWVRRDGFTWRVHRQTRAERVEAARSAALARQLPEGGGSPEARTPMPGTVVAVHVASGDTVTEGQHLADVEAMKMEHPITAGVAGVVTVHVSVGQSAPAQGLIATIEPTES